MIDEAWKVLDSVNEWVRFADAKAIGALAGAGLIGGALGSAALSDKFAAVSLLVLFFGIAAGFSAVISASLAVWVLVPRLRVGEPDSLIYFEHVARKFPADRAAYTLAMEALFADRDRYFDHVVAQAWANSKVARGKYIASSWALAALGLAVVLVGISAMAASV